MYTLFGNDNFYFIYLLLYATGRFIRIRIVTARHKIIVITVCADQKYILDNRQYSCYPISCLRYLPSTCLVPKLD